jgi:hypothetical protein
MKEQLIVSCSFFVFLSEKGHFYLILLKNAYFSVIRKPLPLYSKIKIGYDHSESVV